MRITGGGARWIVTGFRVASRIELTLFLHCCMCSTFGVVCFFVVRCCCCCCLRVSWSTGLDGPVNFFKSAEKNSYFLCNYKGRRLVVLWNRSLKVIKNINFPSRMCLTRACFFLLQKKGSTSPFKIQKSNLFEWIYTFFYCSRNRRKCERKLRNNNYSNKDKVRLN